MAEPTPNLVHVALSELDNNMLTSPDGKNVQVSLEAICRLLANPPLYLAPGTADRDAARQQGYREGRDAAAELATGRRALMGPSTYAMGAADMAEELAEDIRALTPEDKTP